MKKFYVSLLLLIVVSLISCNTLQHPQVSPSGDYYVDIEENIHAAYTCEDTYFVTTKVYVKNKFDRIITLELWEQDKVSAYQVDSIRTAQRARAEVVKTNLEACL